MPPFEAHLDVTKALIMIIGAGVFALGGLAFAGYWRSTAQYAGWTSDTIVPLAFGLVLFFVMATVAFKGFKTYRQGQSGPIVRIDDSGVLDLRVGPQVIPWAAIRGAEIKDISNAAMIRGGNEDERERLQVMGVVLKVEEAARYLSGDSALEATAKSLAQVTNFDEIHISPSGLHSSAEEILAAIEARR